MGTLPEYCFRCGSQLNTKRIEGQDRAYCSRCEQPVYRNAKPCAGVIVRDETDVLLVKRTNPPGVGSWSIPAGFLEVDEPPKKAAVRELSEETGLEVALSDIELFETNLVAHPDNKYVLVIIYVAARDATTGSVRAGSDAADAKFWNIDDLSTANESIELGYEPILREAIGED